jgi:hypothetical protein
MVEEHDYAGSISRTKVLQIARTYAGIYKDAKNPPSIAQILRFAEEVEREVRAGRQHNYRD